MSAGEKFYLLLVLVTFIGFGVSVALAERAQMAARRASGGHLAPAE